MCGSEGGGRGCGGVSGECDRGGEERSWLTRIDAVAETEVAGEGVEGGGRVYVMWGARSSYRWTERYDTCREATRA